MTRAGVYAEAITTRLLEPVNVTDQCGPHIGFSDVMEAFDLSYVFKVA